ncbi:hypothetical protein, partial [Pseudomonas palmensis]
FDGQLCPKRALPGKMMKCRGAGWTARFYLSNIREEQNIRDECQESGLHLPQTQLYIIDLLSLS